jgi:type VI secretion system protein ImpM
VFANSPGWFGKLSCLGDFASRRLPPAWLQACDPWLSRGMQAGKQQLGDGFLDAYLHAPVWRFCWAPQVLDESWWFGALMASCDNVGRYFPLVVAQARPQPPSDRFGLDHLDLWWSHIVRTQLQTLAPGATLEHFEAELAQAPPWPGVAPAWAWAEGFGLGPQAGPSRHAVPPQAALTDVVHALAAAQLRQRLLGHSFWWPAHDAGTDVANGANGSLRSASDCRLTPGLPEAGQFVAMMAAR